MKRVVLFDFHNTLATCDCWLDLEIRTLPARVLARLAEYGVLDPAPDREIEAIARFKSLRQAVRESGVELSALEGTLRVLQTMGLAPPEPSVGQAVRELEEECLADLEPVSGAAQALGQLRDAGYRLGVVSSAGYPPFVELALEALGLRSFFSEVVTSAGEGIYKSNPEIYRRAAERIGALPGEAVHVGDHPAFDVEAAAKAGLATIWLTAHAKRTATMRAEPLRDDELARSNASVIISSMDELFEAVESLNRQPVGGS